MPGFSIPSASYDDGINVERFQDSDVRPITRVEYESACNHAARASDSSSHTDIPGQNYGSGISKPRVASSSAILTATSRPHLSNNALSASYLFEQAGIRGDITSANGGHRSSRSVSQSQPTTHPKKEHQALHSSRQNNLANGYDEISVGSTKKRSRSNRGSTLIQEEGFPAPTQTSINDRPPPNVFSPSPQQGLDPDTIQWSHRSRTLVSEPEINSDHSASSPETPETSIEDASNSTYHCTRPMSSRTRPDHESFNPDESENKPDGQSSNESNPAKVLRHLRHLLQGECSRQPSLTTGACQRQRLGMPSPTTHLSGPRRPFPRTHHRQRHHKRVSTATKPCQNLNLRMNIGAYWKSLTMCLT